MQPAGAKSKSAPAKGKAKEDPLEDVDDSDPEDGGSPAAAGESSESESEL